MLSADGGDPSSGRDPGISRGHWAIALWKDQLAGNNVSGGQKPRDAVLCWMPRDAVLCAEPPPLQWDGLWTHFDLRIF